MTDSSNRANPQMTNPTSPIRKPGNKSSRMKPIVALLLLAAVIRLVQMAFNSQSGSIRVESPDKKFIAYAASVSKVKFWGGTHNFYEFTVEAAADGTRVHHIIVDQTPQERMSWSGRGAVVWFSNSTFVECFFDGSHLTLKVPAKNPPEEKTP